MISRLVFAVVAALVGAGCALPAAAEDFYAGKQINLIVGAGVGGGYDLQARLTARHLGKHIPGHPSIIVQNMPAAGGIQATNHIYSGAPKDGTMIALVQRGMLLAKLTYPQSVRFEIDKLNWIGSLNSEVAVAIAWHTSPVKKAEDLFVQELVVGAAGATDQSNIFPTALNRVLGTKFKVVAGYRGSADNALALERGEVAGIGGMNFSSIQATRPDWLKDAKVNVLLQLSLQRHPELPNVPTALDIGRTDTEKTVLKLVFAQSQMGRAVFAPPGLAPDRTNVLRAAFQSMVKDPEFLAEANKGSIEINQPMSGQEMAQLVSQLHSSAPELIKRASEAIAVAGQ